MTARARWSCFAAAASAQHDAGLPQVEDISGGRRFADRSTQLPPDTDDTRGVDAADVDGDGDVDLVFATDNAPNRLLLNDGNGNFVDQSAQMPSEIEHALTPFGRVGNVFSSTTQGVGLGLPICRSMMDLLGGTLRIESRPGQGTIVTLDFPP